MKLIKMLSLRALYRALFILLALFTIFFYYLDEGDTDSASAFESPSKVLALTFDDGPYKKITGRILDTLEKHSIKATFFIIGSRVTGREDMLLRMESLGCEIGNHTYSHLDLTRLSKARCIEEIELANKEFERVVGHGAKLVRPPYGFYNKCVRESVDYPLVLWTIDTNDWKPRNTAELAQYIMSKACNESIILMHDEQSSTAEALDIAIPALIELGYKFVTVSELIELCGARCTAIA